MAEHRIRKDNIIYIIPNDELFAKLKEDEAFIDDYGRLMNRKPHRVLKELKYYVDDSRIVQQRQQVSVRTEPTVKDYLKDIVRDGARDVGEVLINRAVDIFLYEVLPNVWQEHIVPFYGRTKESLISKEVRVDAVIAKSKKSAVATVKPEESSPKMTQEEADAEKRRVLYHWLGMLISLKKLQDAGEMDAASTLTQLTDPAMLDRVNGFLNDNPNLLETDKYIMLHGLLGRDLYKDKQLIPIEADEITTIAAAYGYKEKKWRNNHNG
jgi:hypothetical protein